MDIHANNTPEVSKTSGRFSLHKIGIYAFIAVVFFVVGLSIGTFFGNETVGSTQTRDNVVTNMPGDLASGDALFDFSFGRSTDLPDFVNKDEVDFELFWEVWGSLEERYVEQPVDDKELFYGAIHGMVKSLGDPYTVFFPPVEAEEFNQELEGKFEGIGAEIALKNEILTIVAPLPGTPAERAGLRPGDAVFAIDDEDTFGMSLNEAVHLIRGERGSTVVLTVLHKDKTETVDIEIIRDEIKIHTITWEMIGKSESIAYIDIFSFNDDTERDFLRAVNDILEQDPQGIILDVRSNPGGFLDAAVEISGVWVASGERVLQERFFDQTSRTYSASGPSPFNGIPTIVLVNIGSASASEIVAGALRDQNQATIVGEKTFGKGSVQDYSELRGGSALKVTIAEWLTPNGTSINQEGIIPDEVVELTTEDYNNDLDPQLDRAIELLGG